MTELSLHPFLDAAALRARDIPAPWTVGMADTVRFGELDILGHVNNTAYLQWFETFRVSYFQAYGIADYLAGEVPRIVLRQVGVDFLAEMKLGDSYTVTGRTVEMRRTSFRMEYGVWSGGTLRATGWAIIVTLDDGGTKTPLSEAMRATFTDRDGAVAL